MILGILPCHASEKYGQEVPEICNSNVESTKKIFGRNTENSFIDVIYNYETFDPQQYGDESIKQKARVHTQSIRYNVFKKVEMKV